MNNRLLFTTVHLAKALFRKWLVLLLLLWVSSAAYAQLTVTLDATNPACGGFNTGSITANPSGGMPPYTYLWNTGDTTQTISNLGVGTYTVTVTDAAMQTATATTTLTAPPPLTLDFTVSNCAVPGTVTANPGGGVPGYTYSWSTGETTQSITYMAPGTFCVTVMDAVNCAIAGCVTVTIEAPTINLITNDITCNGYDDGSITADATGSMPPYTYLWSTGETTQTISNLAPGSYTVTVTGSNGCSATATGTVSEPPPLTATISGNDPTCAGSTNGSAMVVASGGTPPYSYLWNTGATTPVITNLPEGNYSVTVTDANGCDISLSITLTEQSAITVVASSTDETCSGYNDGTATATASNGVPPYTYQWSNGQNGSFIDNLPPGTYSVTATDAVGCTASTSVVVLPANPFSVSITSTDVTSCNGSDGTATAMPSGGAGGYTYLWNTGETTQTITGLSAGTYVVVVTDANGCTATASVTITAPASPMVGVMTTDETCSGDEDGTATAVVVGGTPPYTYLWNTGETTASIANLPPGVYTVTVTDANGCTDTASGVVAAGTLVQLMLSGQDVSCFGYSDGGATAVPFDGTPPYSYLWNTGATSQTISNLPAGTYSVTVTDANGCQASGSIFISEPPELTLEVDLNYGDCSTNAAAAVALAEGGTPPYTYTWSTGDSGPVVMNLPPGDYSVTVMDANGCEASQNFTVEDIPPLSLALDVMDVSCYGFADGSITALPTGGTPLYSYVWSTGETTQSISNLAPGVYSVTVTDANGCEAMASATVAEPLPLSLALMPTDASCPGSNDGSIVVNVSGGTPPYTYTSNIGPFTPPLTNLAPGSYTVTVTDANGCEVSASATVGLQSNPSVVIEVLNQPCEGAATGILAAVPSGGIAPYTYLWSTGDMGPMVQDLPPGNYSVVVTDALGCTASAAVVLEAAPNPTCTAEVVQPVSSPGASDGVVTVNASGGTPPYTYLWSTGATTQTVSNLSEGFYSVTTTDANGCQTSCSVQLGTAPTTCVGDKVWLDLDQDGIQDPNETGVAGVTVTLTGTDDNGNPVNLTQVTDSAGMYLFNPIPGGTYKLTFSLPANHFFTVQDAGSDDSVDSDVDTTTGMTPVFVLVANNTGSCDLNWDAGLYVICDNITDPGEIAGDEFLCGPGNDPGPIVETAPATGGTGNIEYLWMMTFENQPFNPNTWIPIPNSNVPEYDPGPIFETTYYARCARREGCIEFLETSNIVVKEVGDVAVAQIDGPNVACEGDTETYTALDNGAGATYLWDFGPHADPQTSTDPVVDVTWLQYGLYTVQLTVEKDGCTSYAWLDVFVTNSSPNCGGGSPLMVLQGQPIADGVHLSWTAEGMGEGDEFVLERSFNGVENFEPLALVPFDSESETYDFQDTAPRAGVLFYRLRVSRDGGEAFFSNLVEIRWQQDNQWLLIYPNPVRDVLLVQSLDPNFTLSELKLYDLTGRLLYREGALQEGKLYYDIPAGQLPAGVYLLSLQSAEGQTIVEKVVKE